MRLISFPKVLVIANLSIGSCTLQKGGDLQSSELEASRRPAPQIFKYDAPTGNCLNSAGIAGLNEVTMNQIYRTKNGACANLKAKCLVPKGLLINGDEAMCMPKQDTSIAKEIDFRGADFRDARLAGYYGLINCKLEGANLSELDFHGYATIQGSANSFTKLPGPDFTKAECNFADDAVSCVSHQQE
jgi:hypothetical protein